MKRKAIIFTEDTENLLQLATYLVQDEWEIISGGESAEFLESNSIQITKVPSFSAVSRPNDGFMDILNLVTRTHLPNENDFHILDADADCIPLVCVNIAPKYKDLSNALEISSIANDIDLKHISLIRAAAKNYTNILILTDPADYQEAIIQLRTESITNEFRLYLVAKALNLTAAYDSGISISILYQSGKIDFPNYFVLPYKKEKNLLHGINAHQPACLYSLTGAKSALSGMKKIQGEEIDFNIIKNSSVAWNVITTFLKILKNPFEVPSTDSAGYSYPTQFTPAAGSVFTIGIKFCNPVGAAFGPDAATSFLKTLNCAPESFDGAALGCSAVIDEKAAREIIKIDISAIVAPDFTKEARAILAEKKSIRLITVANPVNGIFEASTVDGGILTQVSDHILFKHWYTVTKKRPTQQQIDAMALGVMISMAGHSYSTLILNDGATIGISSGQASKRKSISIAINDAQECFKNNLTSFDTNAEVLVSDDSIPFGDYIYRLSEIGVKAIIQTGGTSTDQQLIDYCNEHEISMIFTKMTHLNF